MFCFIFGAAGKSRGWNVFVSINYQCSNSWSVLYASELFILFEMALDCYITTPIIFVSNITIIDLWQWWLTFCLLVLWSYDFGTIGHFSTWRAYVRCNNKYWLCSFVVFSMLTAVLLLLMLLLLLTLYTITTSPPLHHFLSDNFHGYHRLGWFPRYLALATAGADFCEVDAFEPMTSYHTSAS